jgi:hypothetical protein
MVTTLLFNMEISSGFKHLRMKTLHAEDSRIYQSHSNGFALSSASPGSLIEILRTAASILPPPILNDRSHHMQSWRKRDSPLILQSHLPQDVSYRERMILGLVSIYEAVIHGFIFGTVDSLLMEHNH